MRAIFLRGVRSGVGWVYDGTPDEAAEACTKTYFKSALEDLQTKKEARKIGALEDWDRRGRQPNEGTLPGIAEHLLGQRKDK